MNEDDLKQIFVNYLKKNNFCFRTEVGMLECRIDVVGKKKRKLYAYELKIEHWKKAIQQAILYQLFADYSCIVMYKENLHRLRIKKCQDLGLGVFSLDSKGHLSCILQPKKSTIINPSLYKRLTKKFE